MGHGWLGREELCTFDSMSFGQWCCQLVVEVVCSYVLKAWAFLQPMKTKPRKIWEVCLLLCSCLTVSRPNPKSQKNTPLHFLFLHSSACLAGLNPSVLFPTAWPLTATVLLSCQSFLVTDGISHEPWGRREGRGL